MCETERVKPTQNATKLEHKNLNNCYKSYTDAGLDDFWII